MPKPGATLCPLSSGLVTLPHPSPARGGSAGPAAACARPGQGSPRGGTRSPRAPQLCQTWAAPPGPGEPLRGGRARSWVHTSALTVVEGAARAKLGARQVPGALKSHFAGFGGMNFSFLVTSRSPARVPQHTRPCGGSYSVGS